MLDNIDDDAVLVTGYRRRQGRRNMHRHMRKHSVEDRSSRYLTLSVVTIYSLSPERVEERSPSATKDRPRGEKKELKVVGKDFKFLLSPGDR